MPFDNTRVIPDDWSAHHAAAAAGAMTATVDVGLPGVPVYDPATDDTTATWASDYAGPARIQPLNQADRADVAGQTLAGRAYLVQLPLEARPATLPPGRIVKVTAAAHDPRLAGQRLYVIDEQFGSEGFTRDLVCSDNQADVPTT
jgi:hypothetical protein